MPVRDRVSYVDRTSWQLLPLLIADNDGTDIQVGPVHARAANVPLFSGTGGNLRQGIRIALRGDGPETAVVCTVRNNGHVIAEQRATASRDLQSILLFVPEVTEEVTFDLAIATGDVGNATQPFTVRPQRKWSVHLIHHSHYDIGYTDPQATVINSQLAYIDSALDLIAATDEWPEDAQFRWNIEVTDPLRRWLAARPRAIKAEFFRRVKEGRIEINALPFSMHTEAYSLDELARQLKFADDLREQHALEIVSAVQTDVPGATTGLASLLTAAGIRYFAVAHNYAGRSVPHLVGGQDLSRPFYWQAPDGKRLLVWMTDSTLGYAYMEGNLAGFISGYDASLASLPELLAGLGQRPYPYGKNVFSWVGTGEDFPITKQPYPYDVLHLRVQGAFADNAAPNLLPAEIVKKWNETWAYPRLRMSTNRDFFAEIEERYGPDLATHQGDWTDWWADGIGSAALPLGLNRQAQSDIRTAQTLHTLADTVLDLNEEPQPAVAAEVDAAYDDLALFDEHTWGAANPWRDSISEGNSGALQWARKSAFAYEASERASALVASGSHRVAALAATTSGVTGIAVINPSSWSRTDLVRVFIPESRGGWSGSFSIVEESSGTTVPVVIEPQTNEKFRPRGYWATFLARNVPPIGYARYQVIADQGQAGTSDSPAGDDGHRPLTLESDTLRLTVAPREAHIAELVQTVSGRNLIDPRAPFGFNEYIYDVYATAPGFNHLSGRVHATDLSLLGSRSTGRDATIVARSSNAVWDRVTLRSSGEGSGWIETTLTLPHGLSRLDITNRLRKIATPAKESVYFAFPFAADQPRLTYEITGDLVGPDSPFVPGSARHFRAIRNWITIESAGAPPIAWATGEAPLIQTGTIHLPYSPFPSTLTPQSQDPATIYSWALNNLWDTNFPHEQGGEMAFRYAIATDDGRSATELGRDTAAAVTTPLVGVCGSPYSTPKGEQFGPTGSFCSLDHPNLTITHLAPSRRGHDLVAFVESTATEPITAQVTFGLLPVVRAAVGTFLERALEDLAVLDDAVTVTVPPGALVSISLDLA